MPLKPVPFLLALALLWPSLGSAQNFCPCLSCLNPRIDALRIPSNSMKPTVLPGACVTGRQFAGEEHARPADLIYFYGEQNGQEQMFISRVIALGGQVVELRQGRLWLDGEEVPWARVGEFSQFPSMRTGPVGLDQCPNQEAFCEVPIIAETINGVTFQTLDIYEGTGPVDNYGPVTVPEGHLFVMQDNRDNSTDSRAPRPQGRGFVPLSDVIGIVHP